MIQDASKVLSLVIPLQKIYPWEEVYFETLIFNCQFTISAIRCPKHAFYIKHVWKYFLSFCLSWDPSFLFPVLIMFPLINTVGQVETLVFSYVLYIHSFIYSSIYPSSLIYYFTLLKASIDLPATILGGRATAVETFFKQGT